MKIAFFETKDWEEKILRKELKNHDLLFIKEPLNDKNAHLARDCGIVSVFVYSKVDDELKQLPNLKLITTRSTGFDHINLEECQKKGIIVCNVPVYAEHSVAEHSFALLLAISRNITKAYTRIHRNNYSIEGLQGFDLNGKIIGVVGTGHIGMHVIRMARGFEMNVLAYSRNRNIEMSRRLGFRYVGLNELLKKSDIITIHLPLTNETKHMIDKKAIDKMKKGVIIINTARGEIIDTKALLSGINNGWVSAVGLDVLEGEELIKKGNHQRLDPKHFKLLAEDHKLLNNEKVIFTPHIAFFSKESSHNLILTTIDNIKSFIKGKTKNCVY